MADTFKLVAHVFIPSIIAEDSKHPNEMKFSGTLVRLDEPSTKAPNGSRGHKILIPKSVAKSRLKTLIGMGVNYTDDLSGHDAGNKVGCIKKAWIEGNAVKVSGVIWKKDFPEAEKKLKKPNLGMSFEGANISVEDQEASVWVINDLHFTGASILYQNKAAYHKTEAIAASAGNAMTAELIKTKVGGNKMAKQLKKIAASKGKPNKVKTVKASEGKKKELTLAQQIAAGIEAAMAPVTSNLVKLNKNIVAMKASNEDFQKSVLEDLDASEEEDEDLEASEDEDEDMDASEDEDEELEASEDEDEDELEASEDEDEDELEAAEDTPKKKRKMKKVSMDDDDDEMEAGKYGADDEDEFEDLEDEGMHSDNQRPGKMNNKVINKGRKTTVSASAREKRLERELKASQETVKNLRKVNKVTRLRAAAADTTDRKSMSPMLTNLLSKEGINNSTISASGFEKISGTEMSTICKNAGLDTQTTIAIKAEAARAGVMDEGKVERTY